MAKKLYAMSPAEKEILRVGQDDPNMILGYFVRRPGAEVGFQLDHNFTEKGAWQVDMCLASQTFIVSITGIGAGKTLGVGMAATYHGIVTPDFKFLNVARESWQSALMHTAILEQANGTLLEELIVNSPTRPYPKIVLEYLLDGQVIRSTLEFMSIGEKGEATNVFSWRGDWINVDEAGLIDELAGVVGNLSTRGTGVTPTGRAYIGRLSLTSNPWENPDLWILYDLAVADPIDSIAFNVDTKDNQNITEKQIKQIMKLIPEGVDKDRFLTSKRPEGAGNYFSKETVSKCESTMLSDMYKARYAEEKDKDKQDRIPVIIQSAPHLGVWRLQMPPKEGRIYFVIGDPGIGRAPSRNAPCLMVFDVTDCPMSPATMVAFWWGDGGNSITPFVTNLIEWIDLYKPIFAGVDNTGPQKNTAELINLDYIWNKGKSIGSITGLDFSGPRKYSYLVATRLSMESGMILWPSFCYGIGSQCRNYDPTLDKSASAKLAQDTVATLSMAAFAIRAQYGIIEGSDDGDGEDARSGNDPPRYPRDRNASRTERIGQGRPPV